MIKRMITGLQCNSTFVWATCNYAHMVFCVIASSAGIEKYCPGKNTLMSYTFSQFGRPFLLYAIYMLTTTDIFAHESFPCVKCGMSPSSTDLPH